MSKPCEFEPLEKRQLLTQILPMATWALTSRGTLVIHGVQLEGVADAISVTRTGDKFRFDANSSHGFVAGERFSASRVKRVLVETYSGNDRVHIDPALGKGVTVYAGAGNDRVDANPGATVIGGGGNDRLYLAPPFVLTHSDAAAPETNVTAEFKGPGLLSGGAGNDTLIAGGADTVVGGLGDDLAILNVVGKNDPATIADKPQFARDAWDDRATGIETFDVIGRSIVPLAPSPPRPVPASGTRRS